MKKYFSHYWFIAVITLLGFFIRHWASVHQPIFNEEAFSVYEAIYWDFPYDPSYPPGYPLFMKFWANFSPDLAWIRLPNVIAGTMSIVIFWGILRRYISKASAQLGALLIACSPLHIHYSWVSRPHAFMALLSLISLAILLKIAEDGKNKKVAGTIFFAGYFFVNTLGAFLSHGFTLFLAGSLISLGIWLQRYGMLKAVITDKAGVFFIMLHGLLPLIQYSFIHSKIGSLADSAAWIPDLNLEMMVSVMLTLLNTTKVLTGELYATSLVVVYIMTIVIGMVLHATYRELHKYQPFLALMLVITITTTFAGSIVAYYIFDLSILQPRLLLPLHILFIVGFTVTLPVLPKLLLRTPSSMTIRSVEALFLCVFLIFGIRSFVLLNVTPYYSTPDDIRTIQQLADDQESTVIVFPRYELLTVHHLWGFNDNISKPLREAFLMMDLPADATLDQYLRLLPHDKPFTVIYWKNSGILSPGAKRFIDKVISQCHSKHGDTIHIFSCPTLSSSL